MLKRLVLACGPDALDLSLRVIGLLGQKHRTWVCAGHLMMEHHSERKLLFAKHQRSIHRLGEASRILDKSRVFPDLTILACRLEAPPPSTWVKTLPFHVYVEEVPKVISRFDALTRTARLIALLGMDSPEIDARMARAVDP